MKSLKSSIFRIKGKGFSTMLLYYDYFLTLKKIYVNILAFSAVNTTKNYNVIASFSGFFKYCSLCWKSFISI